MNLKTLLIGLAFLMMHHPATADTGMDSLDPEQVIASLSEGQSIFAVDDADPLEYGGSQIELGSVQNLSLQDADGRSGKRVRTGSSPEAPWSVQLYAVNSSPIRDGDRLLATFWMRCEASITGQGFAEFVFEEGPPNYAKSVSVEIGAGHGWQRFDVPFVAHRDFAVGEARVVFQLGYSDQTMEIAGLDVVNYRDTVTLDDLPSVEFTYEGREPDAAWRQDAAERIERLRKGDLDVLVIDASGQPVPGAEIRVEMTRHAFSFGSAVAVEALLAEGDAYDRYREQFERLFNEAVFENAMKWNNHGIGSPEMVDEALAWLAEREIGVRGHVLVWPGWRWIPSEIQDLSGQPEVLRLAVEDRVTLTASRYAGHLTEWDVLNEPFNNRDLMDIFGDEVMVDWFVLAKQADPDARLYLNDWGLLSGGRTETPHQRMIHDTLRYLLDNGAPVEGIGLQGHFGWNPTPPERMLEILDWFGEYGLPIKVTEFDIDVTDEQLQADFLRDLLTVTFSHEAVDGVLIWGFWAERHWRPTAAMYRSDWSARPAALVWEDLVLNQWWTRERGTTGDDGRYTIRGFLGDYTIHVTVNGEVTATSTTLSRTGTEVRIELP